MQVPQELLLRVLLGIARPAFRGLKMDDEVLKRHICRKCDFYKEGEDEELECYAYKLSKRLLEEGKIKLEDL